MADRIFQEMGRGFAGDGLEASKPSTTGFQFARLQWRHVSGIRNNLIRKIDGRTNITSTIAGIPGKRGFSGTEVTTSQIGRSDFDQPVANRKLSWLQTFKTVVRAIDLAADIRTMAGNGKRSPKTEKFLDQPLDQGQRNGP